MRLDIKYLVLGISMYYLGIIAPSKVTLTLVEVLVLASVMVVLTLEVAARRLKTTVAAAGVVETNGGKN